jgi:Family of unknown function (DUF5985)
MPEHVSLYDFLSGAVAFGFLVCGSFFLKFWRRTRDELFIAFAIAFALLGAVQGTLALANIPSEERAPIYLFRLLAFVIILFAIFRKNRANA